MAEDRLRKRSEVPEELTWRLEDLFETDEAWSEEYASLGKMAEEAAAFQGRLGSSAETLLSFFRVRDEVSKRLEKFMVYASCRSDEDTGNNFYQDMSSKARSVAVAIMAAASFSDPEIMAIWCTPS